jgi:peptidoglycan/LPS O-acetylase OafA/YrhL
MFVIWPLFILFQHSGFTSNAAPLLFFAAIALSGVLGWGVARFYSEPLNRQLRVKFASREAPKSETAATA